MMSFKRQDLSELRRQVIQIIFEHIKDMLNNELADQVKMEIGLPVSELAANAVEHGENAQYEIYETSECILLIIQNQKKKNDTKKEEGEGGRGIFLSNAYAEIAKPEIKSIEKTDFYEVDIEFNCARIRRNIELQLSKNAA